MLSRTWKLRLLAFFVACVLNLGFLLVRNRTRPNTKLDAASTYDHLHVGMPSGEAVQYLRDSGFQCPKAPGFCMFSDSWQDYRVGYDENTVTTRYAQYTVKPRPY